MLPHPETAIAVMDLRYQELLRAAAKQRLISSAQPRGPSFLARVRPASPVAAWWPRVRQFLAAQLRPRRGAPLSQRPGFDIGTSVAAAVAHVTEGSRSGHAALKSVVRTMRHPRHIGKLVVAREPGGRPSAATPSTWRTS